MKFFYLSMKNRVKIGRKLTSLRVFYEQLLMKEFGKDCIINFQAVKRLPNTLNVTFLQIPDNCTNKDLVVECAKQGLIIASGAACHSEGCELSILEKCGIEKKLAVKSVRISLGRETTKEEIEKSVKIIKSTIECLKKK